LLGCLASTGCVVDITGAPCARTTDCPDLQVCIDGFCRVPDGGSAGGAGSTGGGNSSTGGGTGGGAMGTGGSTGSVVATSVQIEPKAPVADGVDSVTITVSVLRGDAGVGGTPVTVTSNDNADQFTPNGGITAAGKLVIVWTSTHASVKTAAVIVDGVTYSLNATFVAGPPSVAHSTLLPATNTAVADGTSLTTLTLTARDTFDNPTPGQTVTLTMSGRANTITLPSGTTASDGTMQAQVSSKWAELKTVSALVGGVGPLTATVRYAWPVCASHVSLGGQLPSLSLGAQPTRLAVGEINGDGRPDLVVGTNGLPMKLLSFDGGLGSGSLVSQSLTGAAALVLADFNADGFTDFVHTTSFFDAANGTGRVVVTKGLAGGLFGVEQEVSVPAAPVDVVVAQLNADTLPDFAVISRGSGMLTGYTTNPDGGVPVRLAGFGFDTDGGGDPISLATLDLNRDLKPDFVAVDNTQARLLTYTSSADGGYQLSTTAISSGRAARVTAADLDGDGPQELIVTIPNDAGVILVLKTSPSGLTLTGSALYNVGPLPREVVAAHLNGDGFLDLVVTNSNATVSVLINNGTGGFLNAVTYPVAIGGFPVAALDVNQDGLLDLVVGNDQAGSTTAAVLINRGGGRFADDFNVGVGPGPMAVGDFNGDRRLDVSVGFANGGVQLFSVGDGGLANQSALPAVSSPTFYTLSAPTGVTSGDFNADGFTDLATSRTRLLPDGGEAQSLLTVFSNSNSGFTTQQNLALNGFRVADLAATRITSAGVPDLIASTTAGCEVFSVGDAGYSFLLQYSSCVFSNVPSQALATGSLVGASGGGFVGSGNANGRLTVVGSTTSGFLTPGSGVGYTSFAVGDFNGDGHGDIAAGRIVSGGATLVTLYLTSGTDLVWGEVPLSLPVGTGGPTALTTGDYNGDGRLDLAVLQSSSQTLTLFLGGLGTSPFGIGQVYGAPAFATSMVSGDFNDDGRPDLVIASKSTNLIRLMSFEGCAP
jgi:hypothetical protein